MKEKERKKGDKYTILISEKEAEIIVSVFMKYIDENNDDSEVNATPSDEKLLLDRLLKELWKGWRREEA